MSQPFARDSEPASAPQTSAWPDKLQHPTAQRDQRINKDRAEPSDGWSNVQPDVWPWAKTFCLIYGVIALVMTTGTIRLMV